MEGKQTTTQVTPLRPLSGKQSIVHQLLYLLAHIAPLRHGVYALDLPTAPSNRNLVKQLQKLVYALRRSDALVAPDIQPITDVFGWQRGEERNHSEVLELMQLVFDRISSCQRADAEFKLVDLTCGQFVNTLQWEDVSLTPSRRTEPAQTVCVTPKFGSLVEALKSYHGSDAIEGVQHDSGHTGTAYRRSLWHKLPSVLFIDIQRAGYDWETMRRVSRTNRFEFAADLDAATYVDPSVIAEQDDSKPFVANFSLAAVLAYDTHALASGSLTLLTFIREFRLDGSSWTRLSDDGQAQLCSEAEALQGNFGGPDVAVQGRLLVYVRNDFLPPQGDSLKLQTAIKIAKLENPDSVKMPMELRELVQELKNSAYLRPDAVPSYVTEE